MTANGHNIADQAEELMCLGGPLHGQIRPRGLLLTFDVVVAANQSQPNPKFIDEPHTYVLSTFDYSPETSVKFWRHKPLDLGRAGQFIMLDFLVNRPSLKAAQAFACLRALHGYVTTRTGLISTREVAALIETVIRPAHQPQNKDPQP